VFEIKRDIENFALKRGQHENNLVFDRYNQEIRAHKLNMTPIQFVRRNEQVYKELVSKQMQPTDDVLIDAMIAYPILIERPIVVIENQAVIGRPPENVLSIIS
jgi:arsenate reductase (glutaredoxin)